MTGLPETWSPNKPRIQKTFVQSLSTTSHSGRKNNAQNPFAISQGRVYDSTRLFSLIFQPARYQHVMHIAVIVCSATWYIDDVALIRPSLAYVPPRQPLEQDKQMFKKLSKFLKEAYGWQTRRWDPGTVSVSGTVREVLTVGVGGGPPLTGITNSSATTHGLKTSRISSSVNWASEPCQWRQAGQLHRVVR